VSICAWQVKDLPSIGYTLFLHFTYWLNVDVSLRLDRSMANCQSSLFGGYQCNE
jgi:hypothetical protein